MVDKLHTAIVAALNASAAQFGAATLLVSLPLLAVAYLLSLLHLPLPFIAPLVVCAHMLPLSLLAHEFAHAAVAVTLLPTAERHLVFGAGTVRRSSIYRPATDSTSAALISVAGPTAGLACAVPVMLVGSDVIGVFPWILPFLVHLASLSPSSADGAHILRYAKGLLPRA
ncbi:MAG TPA: hypothetical protein VNT53_09150 [Pseudolysinimonas sp.]|nr:hypothetical protein [Pseudolysinimonas sp.]